MASSAFTTFASLCSLQTRILCSPTHKTDYSLPSLQLKALSGPVGQVLVKVPEIDSNWSSVNQWFSPCSNQLKAGEDLNNTNVSPARGLS